MNHPTDELIDHVLHALRDTEPSSGFEARILSRLDHAKASQAPASTVSALLRTARAPRLWSPTQARYAFAAAALVLVATTTLLVSRPHQQSPATAYNHSSQPFALPRATAPATPIAQPPQLVEARSIRHPRPDITQPSSPSSAPTDPDAIALAETLAPSRPAPAMPLTAQEALLYRATRQGQPIELAELSHVRETSLRTIADAREHSSLRQYIQSLLAPLAAAQAVESTPSPSPDPAPTAAPADPSSPPSK